MTNAINLFSSYWVLFFYASWIIYIALSTFRVSTPLLARPSFLFTRLLEYWFKWLDNHLKKIGTNLHQEKNDYEIEGNTKYIHNSGTSWREKNKNVKRQFP